MRTLWFLAAGTLLVGTVTSTVNGPVGSGWSFPEETVRLDILEGSFVVRAEYVFVAGRDAEPMPLLLRFPKDETLREPQLLEAGITCRTASRPLPVVMGADGWRFVLSGAGPQTCRVAIAYYQPMSCSRAVYILRSAREWGRALKKAVLEVRVPEDTECTIRPTLEPAGSEDGWRIYRGSFENWLPREDLVVELR